MTPQQLLAAARILVEQAPDAELVRTQHDVGNLGILVDGGYLGWVDLSNGDVNWLSSNS